MTFRREKVKRFENKQFYRNKMKIKTPYENDQYL